MSGEKFRTFQCGLFQVRNKQAYMYTEWAQLLWSSGLCEVVDTDVSGGPRLEKWRPHQVSSQTNRTQMERHFINIMNHSFKVGDNVRIFSYGIKFKQLSYKSCVV
jgi:hypothetical protein